MWLSHLRSSCPSSSEGCTGSREARLALLHPSALAACAACAALAALNRVLLLRMSDGFDIDVALGAMPFEASAIERSSNAELVPSATLRTCSA